MYLNMHMQYVVHAYTSTLKNTPTLLCTHAHPPVRSHTCTHVYTHTHTHIHTHTHTHTHTHMHTHTHTHTHTTTCTIDQGRVTILVTLP